MIKYTLEKLNYGNLKRYFYFLSLFFIFCCVTRGQETIQITGRVTDNNQNPLIKAQIQLLPADCDKCPSDVVEVFTTNKDGDFVVLAESKTKYHLFIEEDAPTSHWRGINSPSDTIRYLPRYRGIPIFFRRASNTSAKLGNLKPTIQYIKTEIDLQNFISKKFVLVKHSNIKIQTKDHYGKAVNNRRGIAEKYWTDTSKIKLVLPEGIWILDVFNEENGEEKKIGSIKLSIQSEKNIKQFYSTNSKKLDISNSNRKKK